MEQVTPEAQVSQPQAAPAQAPQTQATPVQPAATPSKKAPVWVWILGGCLGIIILSMLAFGILIYLGAKKVKKELRENAPKLEQMRDDAEEFQEDMEDFQKEMEKVQREMDKAQPQGGAAVN